MIGRLLSHTYTQKNASERGLGLIRIGFIVRGIEIKSLRQGLRIGQPEDGAVVITQLSLLNVLRNRVACLLGRHLHLGLDGRIGVGDKFMDECLVYVVFFIPWSSWGFRRRS